MSNSVNLSPKSGDYHVSTSEDPLNIEVIGEEQQNPQLSFSATLSTSFLADDGDGSNEDLASPKERKKSKIGKAAEDAVKKRKETASSITNFFHRLTRFEKDDKKVIEEEDEGNEEVERPDKLASPESGDKWFEIHSESESLEGGGEIYEWEPNSMTEKLVVEPAQEEPTAMFEEKMMFKTLENFRNGEMRWLDEPQLAAMCSVKDAHEDITNTHLRIYEKESKRRANVDPRSFPSDSEDEEEEIQKMFEAMSLKMTNMHSILDTVPFYDAGINRN